ncbi:predicted protein [Naegleria gruberi]|uniref:Predicted protein n=1 Tax=Naegleria gruberi TaxID=5762 RepID=D2V5F2_NAEGR|nr:uncharacterized protein NAEGRDRAFT_63801 [Naegleria gruberi]EFC48103.1 predicted protein [Naegleria gruberi]|eukprot:XP_002680847.1 predicted protein [Naegleria gruberi strain NEG-M]
MKSKQIIALSLLAIILCLFIQFSFQEEKAETHQKLFGYPKDRFLYRRHKGDLNDFVRWIRFQFIKCYGQSTSCTVKKCRYGLRVNRRNGCPICKCNFIRPLRVKKCNRATCTMFCENGFERDRHGCPTCECLRTSGRGRP